MSSLPHTRRFQFSLRAAIVAMILAGVAIGVYVRWPYYVAGRALDAAEGDKSFNEWPLVRVSLINDSSFRSDTKNKWSYPYRVHQVLGSNTEPEIVVRANDGFAYWIVSRDKLDKRWGVKMTDIRDFKR